jgi:hypothetical protein
MIGVVSEVFNQVKEQLMRTQKSRRLFIEELEKREVLSTYFVSTTGSDSNPGSLASPWQTLQFGASNLHPGDILDVQPGTYQGFSCGWDPSGFFGPISGTATQPITIQKDPGAAPGSVIINLRNQATQDGIDLEGCNYVIIDGFTIDPTLGTGGAMGRAGIRVVPIYPPGNINPTNITIRNNTCNQCGFWGIYTSHADNLLIQNNVCSNSGAQHGIYVANACVNPQVIGNTCFNNPAAGIQLNADSTQGGDGLIHNAVLIGNICYNNGYPNGGGTFNLGGVQNSIIENNLLYNCHANGIAVSNLDAAQGSINNIIANNTVILASDSTRYCLNFNNGSTGNTVFNNILYNANSTHGSIEVDSMTGMVFDYNVLDNKLSEDSGGTVESLSSWQVNTGQDKHSINSTPTALFVNAAGSNYLLSAASPAVDAGVSQLAGHNAPTTDIIGTARPQGTTWDIGAYELIQSAPGVATHFSVSAPASTTAGSAFSVTLTALDAFNNKATGYTGTVHFTSSDGAAVLPTDYLFTAVDAGVHTFTNAVTLKTAGTKSVTATDTATKSITASGSLTVSSAAATHLQVGGFSAPTTAGVAHNVTVTALDQFNNIATGYTGTVTFTSSDGQAALPANFTFTAANAGVHSFSASLKTAGTQSITATDTVSGSLTATQASITVNPAAASHFQVNGFTSPTTAGVAHTFTITALDAFGNTATGYTGTVTFTSNDAQATLPANFTFAAANAGVHSFSATLVAAGSRSITATDTVTPTIIGTQSGITVNPAAASRLLVNGFPSPTTAGVAHNVTVTALDPFGNTATGYTGTVTITSSDSQASLPANYAFVAGDAGAHAFSATLRTVGSQSITATDTTTATIKGSQGAITVNSAAAATTLVVAGFPSSTTAGIAHNFTVTAKDAFGNTATSYTGTVTFTSSDPRSGLPVNYTFVSADAGMHTFSGTFKTAGSQSLTATDTVTGTIKGSQTAITVNAAAASRLVVSNFPASTTAGLSQTLKVTAQDAFANIAASYSGTIAFSSTDGQAILPAQYTFTGADAGVHSFSATLRTAGTQSLTAADTLSSTLTGTETGISVSPAAASMLKVSGPMSVTKANPLTITVRALDAFGNAVSNYTGTIHFTSSDSTATLPANYAFVAADAGVHVFSNAVTLLVPGTQTVTATDTVSGTVTGHATIQVNATYAGLVGRVSSSGQWWVAGSNGSSAFTSNLGTTWNPNVTWVDVQTGDFNGDGKTDLLGRDLQNGQWWVAINNGSTFTNSLWATWNPNVTWVDVKVGDFTGNGKDDIVGRYLQTGQWYVGVSTGSSFSTALWATWNPNVTWVDVNVGDFNGDGKADIVGRWLQGGSWWAGISSGASFATSQWASWNPAVTWTDVRVGDFNGDGKSDIIGRDPQAGAWYVGLSNGSSAFTTTLWASWSPTVHWVDVRVGDFNGDGKDDIIGRVLESGQWYSGISNGSRFTTSLWATWSPAVTWVDVQVGDFNGDGKDDIAARVLQNGQIWTGLSNSSTAFNTSLWTTWSSTVTWVDVHMAPQTK